MSDSATQAVYLSYASQDAAVARRICETLRAAGVEVWLDQEGGLVGGDAWDRKIREQIAACALFVPIISANTQARKEGYFRLEWKLAAQRTHMMSERTTFLLPVVIDATRDPDADVPAEFRAVQWTRLPGGDTGATFCARVKTLLGGSELETGRPRPVERDGGVASPAGGPLEVGRRVPAAAWAGALAVIAIGAGATFLATRKSESASPHAGAGTRPPTAEKIPAAVVSEKSVAVLPFANLSGDKEQEYFSDGLTDIFALQEKVARAVVAKLTRRTTTAPVAVLTKSPEAYDAYLRGRALQARGGRSRTDVISFFERAVALDPAFALAWASLAEAKFVGYSRARNRSSELAAEVRVLIDRALELKPDLPEALMVRADWERHVTADFAAAQRDLDRAETLQPATAGLRFIQALVAKDLGKWDDAVRLSRDMVRLDPNNYDYARVHATQIFWRKGDYAEADRLLAGEGALLAGNLSTRVNRTLAASRPRSTASSANQTRRSRCCASIPRAAFTLPTASATRPTSRRFETTRAFRN